MVRDQSTPSSIYRPLVIAVGGRCQGSKDPIAFMLLTSGSSLKTCGRYA